MPKGGRWRTEPGAEAAWLAGKDGGRAPSPECLVTRKEILLPRTTLDSRFQRGYSESSCFFGITEIKQI